MKKFVMLAVVLSAGISGSALASAGGGEAAASPIHFRAQPSATIEQAKENLREYNARLQTLLQGSLGNDEMVQVHQLSYTLEDALKKLNEELAQLAATLEEVHLASEKLDRDAVVSRGRAYLEHAGRFLK